MQADWELSQSFTSDGQGFRVACVLPSSKQQPQQDAITHRLLAGTQGGALWEFHVPSGAMQPVDYQHNHAITALLANAQYYLTGCKDAQVRVFDAATHRLLHTLEGHDKAVTALSWATSDLFWSGSWDGTAKLWNIHSKALLLTLPGHENTVSVCALPSSLARQTTTSSDDLLYVATGSAGIAQNNVISDMSIRLWQVDPSKGLSKLVCHVKNDHDGPIRDVCVWADKLVSCSNDGTVKLRSLETGEPSATLSTLLQDAPILLSLAASTDLLVASAEDGHVFVWQHGASTEPHVIPHASCVWSTLTLDNGDLVTSCQDGFVRVWTQASDRMALLEERQAFATEVQTARTKTSQGPSQDEVAKLPKWELNALQQGKSEGQVQLFNKDGVAIAAQWSMASGTWIEVGQVMGTSEDAGVIDGVQYDHVLPIEVDTADGGVVKLKIGYNNGENTFVAAQRFVDAHMLPQYHSSQIADYIQQRVGNTPTTLGPGAPAGGAGAGAPMATYEHIPAKGYLSFELGKVVSLEKMQTKLKDMGKLSDAQMSQLESLLQTLGATNRYHSTTIDSDNLKLIEQMLQWATREVFPAIDLARITVLHPDAASRERSMDWRTILQLAFRQCQQVTEKDGTAAFAIPMLTLRLYANCFRGGPGSLDAVVGNLDGVLDCAEMFVSSSNKNVRLSVATLLFNISSYLHLKQQSVQGHRVISIINKVLETRAYESEATTRALIALGTVCLSSSESNDAARTLYMTSKVEMAASPHGDKAKAVAKEVYNVLS